MSKQKDVNYYRKIQKYLEAKIKKNDISSIEQFIRSHIEDILDIYLKFGSGNEYLRSPYNSVCFTHPDIALKYQLLLESTIAADVLFSDK